MPFITQKGCCGSSLQKTCLVIGIVFLVLNICSLVFGFFYGNFLTHGVSAIIYIIISICLILAAKLQNKYLCIPWFIGFAIAVIWLIISLIAVVQYTGQQTTYSNEQYDPHREDSTFKTALIVSGLVYCTIIFLVLLVLLRYVISYYVELGNRTD